MRELDNAINQLEKAIRKKEQADNKVKLLNQKISKLKRNKDTQRKVRKGGVFEAFEREITGRQEETNNDLIYAFLDYVLSDNRSREKLKELTEIHLKDVGLDIEKIENPYGEKDSAYKLKEENFDEDMEDNFFKSED